MSLQPEDAMSGTNIIFPIERLLDYLLNTKLYPIGRKLPTDICLYTWWQVSCAQNTFSLMVFFSLKKRKKNWGKKLQFLWNVFFNNQADLVYLLRENAQIMQDY